MNRQYIISVIASSHQLKRFNRRMSAWAKGVKGVLAEAMYSVCVQCNAKHNLVNGAYTSPMSVNKLELGGYRVNQVRINSMCNFAQVFG